MVGGGANKLRITLDQLRMAAKQGSRKTNPCYNHIEKIIDAMEASGNYNVQPYYKLIKEADECYAKADIEDKNKKGKASTLFFLSKYLDRQKFKKK